MPLGAKEPNRNYTVYGKFKSPSSLLYWSRKQRLYLAINKIAGLFFTYSAHPLTIKKYGGFDMTNMFKICQLFLFTLSLVILFSVTIVIAQEGLLDGKVFVGQSKEKHKRAVKEDELRFMNGEFQSIGYGQKGFNEGVYAARAEEDKIYFEAETVNPKQGKIKWSGIVHGDSIEVNYRWSKKGWLSDTEKDYSFNGTLKK